MSSEEFYTGRPVFVDEKATTIAFWFAALLLACLVVLAWLAWSMYKDGFLTTQKVREYEIESVNDDKVLIKRRTIFGTKRHIVSAHDLKNKSKYLLG